MKTYHTIVAVIVVLLSADFPVQKAVGVDRTGLSDDSS